MKKIIVFVLFLTTITSFAGVEDILRKPAVDKRVELMSIVFRLAGKKEYIDRSFKLYTDRVDKHFERYKNHELITFTKSIMYDCGIGYDAVIVMGLSLDNKLNLVNEGTLDDRWKKEHRYKFVKLLKKFYKDSRFDEFYKSNKDLYEESAKRFLPIYEAIDLNWYTKFYGTKPTGEFIIINGLGTGGCSYGPSFEDKKGKKSVYAIVGTWSVDGSLGVPLYNCDQFLPVLLHEFNHSFVNYLTDNNRELFRSSGEQLFSLVEEPMRAQAYGSWTTVLNEALVRAAVIKYMKDHDYGDYAIERAIRYEINKGFTWIKELISELDNYDKQRDIYPTLGDYIPKIAEAYKGYYEITLKHIKTQQKKP